MARRPAPHGADAVRDRDLTGSLRLGFRLHQLLDREAGLGKPLLDRFRVQHDARRAVRPELGERRPGDVIAAVFVGRGDLDLVFLDIKMPGMDGLEVLRKVRETSPETTVIIMTAYSDLESAVAAFQGGAFEYLPKPFDVDHAVDLIRRAMEEVHPLRVPLVAESSIGGNWREVT